MCRHVCMPPSRCLRHHVYVTTVHICDPPSRLAPMCFAEYAEAIRNLCSKENAGWCIFSPCGSANIRLRRHTSPCQRQTCL
ncbi:spore germination protein [Alicyclobacillus hesperidum URH17-3-68]|nr:spore germination protein [Alicyclobacillus hesperidum URH17-3-68]